MVNKSLLLFPLLLSCFFGFAQDVNESVLGTQKLAIVPFDYASDSNHQSVEDMRYGFFESDYSIKKFIEEISYGKASIDGKVYGYRRNQPPLYGIGYTNCFPEDDVIAGQSNVDYSTIDNLVMFVHDTASKSCAAGNSSFGKLPFTTKDGSLSFRRSGFRTQFYKPHEFSGISNSTVAHEIIHSLGISYHSNSYLKVDGEYQIQAYGNLFDIMGLRSQASHPCALIKEQKGWLTDKEIVKVQSSGTYRVYPLEQKLPESSQCLVIDLENGLDLQPNDDISFSKIYIEYRGMTGFDARNRRNVRLKDASDYTIENPHGALIYGIDCQLNDDFCIPVLLDMHPEPIGGKGASYLPHEASDAQLLINESYQIDGNNISIKVTKVVPEEYIEVYVDFNSTSIDYYTLENVDVYPNPVGSMLNIKGIETQNLEYRLFNVYGVKVLAGSNATQIDVNTLKKGVYFLELSNIESGARVVKKVNIGE